MDDRFKQLLPNYKRTIHSFTVLHEGWELDNEGWIVECHDGSRHCVMTNHGGLCLSDAASLQKKLGEYRQVVAGTEKALAMMGVATA